MPYRQTKAVRERLTARRAAILDAAMALALDGGFSAITTDAVAAKADVSIGTVYNNFADRDDIVAAIVTAQLRAVIAAMGDQHPGVLGLARAIAAYIRELRTLDRLGLPLTAMPAFRIGITRHLERHIAAVADPITGTSATLALALYGLLSAVVLSGPQIASARKNEPALISMGLRAIGIGERRALEAAMRASA